MWSDALAGVATSAINSLGALPFRSSGHTNLGNETELDGYRRPLTLSVVNPQAETGTPSSLQYRPLPRRTPVPSTFAVLLAPLGLRLVGEER